MHFNTVNLMEFAAFAAPFLFILVMLRVFFSISGSDSSDPEQKGLKKSFSFLLARLAMLNSGMPMKGYRRKVNDMLDRANQASLYTFEEFLAMQELSGLGTFVVLMILLPEIWYLNIGIALIAFYFPYLMLDSRIKRDKRRIIKDLPFMLDLLSLSVEAGSGLEAALKGIVENFPDRPLRNELRLLIRNMEAGKSTKEALEIMRDRINHMDMGAVCSALIQANQMGSGLADTLRNQSAFIKKKRIEYMREKAKQAATLMIVPLLLFVFPSMFLVILGPIAIRLYLMFYA